MEKRTQIGDAGAVISMLLMAHQDRRMLSRTDYLYGIWFLEEHFPEIAKNLSCREDVINNPDRYEKAAKELREKGLID